MTPDCAIAVNNWRASTCTHRFYLKWKLPADLQWRGYKYNPTIIVLLSFKKKQGVSLAYKKRVNSFPFYGRQQHNRA